LIIGGGGGINVDWDLKTSLEGLYAAGSQMFGSRGHAGAATSGRWAGKSTADYALKASEPEINREQAEDEKNRIYAPLERGEGGIDWKEFNAGICRIMQNYCGEPKNDELLHIGLKAFKEIKEEDVPKLNADSPHKLIRTLEVLDILAIDQMIIHACLARKASSRPLSFIRTDYPKMDPPEWRKWITVKQKDGKAKAGEMSLDFYEPLKENFEAHRDS
jgi:succinate dehydrogenase/fumarate reductase flavoprotein subunit